VPGDRDFFPRDTVLGSGAQGRSKMTWPYKI